MPSTRPALNERAIDNMHQNGRGPFLQFPGHLVSIGWLLRNDSQEAHVKNPFQELGAVIVA